MFSQEPDPSSALGRLALRARRVPAPIRGVLISAALVATIACAVLDVGPYQLIADAQGSVMDGQHYLMLSFLVTFILFALPAGVVIHLLAGRYPELPHAPDPFGPGPFAGRAFPQGPSPYDPQSPYWQGAPGAPPHAPPHGSQGYAQQQPQGYAQQAPQGYAQQAPQAPQGYAPQGHAPQAPQGYAPQAPQGYAPQGHAPQAPQGYAPQAPQAPQGYAPHGSQGYAPQAPQGYAPQGHAPQAPQGHAPQGQPPRG